MGVVALCTDMGMRNNSNIVRLENEKEVWKKKLR